MLDELDKLLLTSEVSYSVLGTGERFLLIDNSNPDAVSEALAYAPPGSAFCGVFTIRNGAPHIWFEAHPDTVRPMLLASLAFGRLIGHPFKPPIEGDSVAWLDALHTLPDTR